MLPKSAAPPPLPPPPTPPLPSKEAADDSSIALLALLLPTHHSCLSGAQLPSVAEHRPPQRLPHCRTLQGVFASSLPRRHSSHASKRTEGLRLPFQQSRIPSATRIYTMAHPGQQVPPRTFSPAQHPGPHHSQPAPSHSPGAQQPGFALPGLPPQGVTPRPQGSHGRTSSFSAPNAHSQPGSPYSVASPGYPASPSVSTPSAAHSPSYQNLQPAPAQQAPHFAPPSYGNRNSPHNPNLNTNFSRPSHIPLNAAAAAPPSSMGSPLTPNPTPGTPGTHQQQYTSQAFAPAVTAPNTPGAMGPPTGRPQREYEYDVTDSLMGTGVNIRDEENALAEYYAGSYGQDARTGLPANEPGNRASLYGAGFANQPGADAGGLSQKEFEAQEAERIFNESASRLAATRSLEHNDPFLNFANLHKRMQDVAQSHGLELNLDNKTNPQQAHVQKTRPVADLPVPKLTITTKVGPDGALVAVNGSVVPTDSFLADQLTLLSLGTKHRVRGLVAECDKLATHRQTTSHGKMPMCWSSEGGKTLEEVGFYDPNDGTNGSGENGIDNGGDEGSKRKRKSRRVATLVLRSRC